VPFSRARAASFWRRVTAPVLYLEGGESPLRLDPADRYERLAILRARRRTIAGSGHHPHLQQPETFAEVVLEFLASAGS